MPNIKSQIKRDKTNELARKANASRKSEVRTAIKKVEAAVNLGKKDEAEAALKHAMSLLDKAAQDRIFPRNTADHKKARLQGLVGKMA
ncbi:MAG: 30S ribosomal protein S20 [Bacilli bacterium]|nr:30S ribosomal protein S20 [Bacilli bacterium]MBO6285264.1 30S ribosomal protein S20 [Bacilli bacterium]